MIDAPVRARLRATLHRRASALLASPQTRGPVRDVAFDAVFRARWGFAPPPRWSDWSGYEQLLSVIEEHELEAIEGDVLEIGVLLGGGTYKLCRHFARMAPDKQVYALDVFDPDVDLTTCEAGTPMADLYRNALQGRDQRSVFHEVTAGCHNLAVLAQDSAQVELPAQRLCFAYVDGNHAADYVRNDFELAWSRLSPGGIVGLDDYGRDLPQVTETVHRLVGEHAREIERVWPDEGGHVFVKRKRR